MLILAFDTSSPAVTVALVRGTETLVERTEVANNKHGELLASLIDQTLTEAGIAPCDPGAVAVGLGPGPFTGLRVGIVTARAMSDALGIPAYGESSLDVMAAELRGGPEYAVVSDARRKQVYWTAYSSGGERLSDPDLGRPDDVAAALDGVVSQVAGAGASMYPEAFARFTVLDEPIYPRAATLGWMVRDRAAAGAPSDDLAPLYLRRPDAQVPGKPKAVTPS